LKTVNRKVRGFESCSLRQKIINRDQGFGIRKDFLTVPCCPLIPVP
jgi:hypothetical protein